MGPIFSMCNSAAAIVTGGKDGMVRVWDNDMTKELRYFKLGSRYKIRALCRKKGHIIVGTIGGELIEIIEKTGVVEVALMGHAQVDTYIGLYLLLPCRVVLGWCLPI